ncbi:MAG TPA: DNA-directed DNA polymerase II small subunit [Candidatus Woesearchaeota archaeon]|nr:DNA-directed DNA polymerase II small subunit [Candidatus Woesearchaeota archaeon]
MEELISKQKEVVSFFLKNNILISPDFINEINIEYDTEKLNNLILKKITSDEFLLLNKDMHGVLLNKNIPDINWPEFEKSKVLSEKGRNNKIYLKFVDYLNAREYKKESDVKILFSYKEESKKREVQDFVSFFNSRYKILENMLKNRQELQNIMSINRILNKKEKENVSLIGLVDDKKVTKNNNILLRLEDQTGSISVLINKNKTDLFNTAKNIVLDEVVGIAGVSGGNIIFTNDIIYPDVPVNKELKKSPDEDYAICLSDLHFGSSYFLSEDFNKFLKWINGKTGNENQKAIAKKVKYIFIIGDLVDGVGIYPNQDKELVVKDIYEQYNGCAELLKQIPQHIKLIICPGNHDAMRIAEPQPVLYKDFAAPIWDLPNAILVSNPALVNIGAKKGFPGFDVLMYHGYSFDYYMANVESIRNNGGYERADLMMKFLLQKRHLAPTHKSTLYIPDVKTDPLVITKIPDFFMTGHIHYSSVSNYRNITMICGSCWQSKTAFQEKVGHHPQPSRVPIINLQTRDVKILKFGK